MSNTGGMIMCMFEAGLEQDCLQHMCSGDMSRSLLSHRDAASSNNDGCILHCAGC